MVFKKQKCIGILPMAGKAERLNLSFGSKELLPLSVGNEILAISEFSLRAMILAGVDEIIMVVSDKKQDVIDYYQKKYARQVKIKFIVYNSPSLPESCLRSLPFLNKNDICLFGLPDTLFAPAESFVKIKEILFKKKSHICLGLFKAKDASLFDSVSFDDKNRVLAVAVKQNPPLSSWVWGIWGAKAGALKKLKKMVDNQSGFREKLLGLSFDALAKRKDFLFTAVKLGNDYFDIGTPKNLKLLAKILPKFSREFRQINSTGSGPVENY